MSFNLNFDLWKNEFYSIIMKEKWRMNEDKKFPYVLKNFSPTPFLSNEDRQFRKKIVTTKNQPNRTNL